MKKLRIAVSLLLLLATAVVGVIYVKHHPGLVSQLGKVDPWMIPVLFFLFLLMTASLAVILHISVKICSNQLPAAESFAVTASSALANFFGPFQSGPGVRALYLKKRHNISIKRYGLVTLYYYGIYAFISGLFLLSGNARWRLPLVSLVLLGAIASGWFIRWQMRKNSVKLRELKVMNILKLGLATFFQISCITLIYFIELHNLNVHVSFGQVITYTGAANFALFVSLTPGGIGVREAFLLFSQRLHHISSSNIVSANILDRSVYIIFLGLLFIYLGLVHGRKLITKVKN